MSIGPGTSSELRRTNEPSPTLPPAGGQSELVHLLNALLRNRLLVLWIPAVLAAVVFVYLLLQPRQYRSDAAFIPQRAQRVPSGFSGIAAQFGIPLGTDGLDQSPAFYVDLVRSREILERVTGKPYEASGAGGTDGRTLLDIYEIDAEDANTRRYRAVERLRQQITPSFDPETGVVSFSVAAARPALARSIADEIVAQINEFNLHRRQSVAEAERAFVQERMTVANGELSAAESELQRFDERNRRIDGSPELVLERDRLQRTVGMRQEVVTMLTQLYEQARIDEVRNTPAITIIERPSLPVEPEPRGAIRFAVAAFVVAAFLGALAAFVVELYRHLQRGESEAHAEFRALRRSIRPSWLAGRKRGS